MARKDEKYDPLPDSFWVAPTISGTTTHSYAGTYPVVELGFGELCTFGFRLPDDFTGLTWARLVMIPDATETVTANFLISADAVGNTRAANISMALGEALAVMADKLTEWEIGSFFPATAAGDYVGAFVSSNVEKLRIIGLAVRYS